MKDSPRTSTIVADQGTTHQTATTPKSIHRIPVEGMDGLRRFAARHKEYHIFVETTAHCRAPLDEFTPQDNATIMVVEVIPAAEPVSGAAEVNTWTVAPRIDEHDDRTDEKCLPVNDPMACETPKELKGSPAEPGAYPQWVVDDLAKSRISEARARELGFKHVKSDEFKSLLGFDLQDKTIDGYAIPFLNPATLDPLKITDGTKDFIRLKLSKAAVLKKDGQESKAKYLTPKSGGVQPYILPETHKHLLENPAVPVVLTEGEKKAICATDRGYPVVGLCGVYGWMRGKEDKRLGVMLMPYASKGRTFVLVYDSDGRDKKHKDDFELCSSQLADSLSVHGCVLKVAYMPTLGAEKVGLDDFLIGHGKTVEELREHVDGTAIIVEPARGGWWRPCAKAVKNAEGRKVVVDGVEILDDQFYEWLRAKGLRKMFINDSLGATLVTERGSIIDHTSPDMLSEMGTDELERGVFQSETMRVKAKGEFSKKARALLSMPALVAAAPTERRDVRRDLKGKMYFHYANGVVEVTRHGWKLVPYDGMKDGLVVWRKHISARDFRHTAETGEYELFFRRARGEDAARIEDGMRLLGYMMHTRKDRSLARCLLVVDEVISEDAAAGRVGKGLISRALGFMRNRVEVEGKDYDGGDKNRFGGVGHDTEIVAIEDIKRNFDFDSLFNSVTEDMCVADKYQRKFHIPFEKSPKILLTSNYALRGDGASHSKRLLIMEVAPYYGRFKNGPADEFGHLLFDEWDEEQWSRFYSFMIGCAQLYLEQGLPDSRPKNYADSALKATTSDSFVAWMDNEIGIVKENLWRKTDLYEMYLKQAESDKAYQPTIQHFGRWLAAWARARGWTMEESKPSTGYHLPLDGSYDGRQHNCVRFEIG